MNKDKQANKLLDALHKELVKNNNENNTNQIENKLASVEKSGIKWQKDLSVLVKSKFRTIIKTVHLHLKKWKNN